MKINKLNSSDLYTHNSTRIPLCIAIETSNWVTPLIKSDIEKGIAALFSKYVRENIGIDMCIINYSKEAKIVFPFELIKDDIQFMPQAVRSLSGEVDLNNLLILIAEQLRLRINDYKISGLNYYTPQILIIGSGNSEHEIGEKAKRVIYWENRGSVSITPIIFENGIEDFFKMLTFEGIVYKVGIKGDWLEMENLVKDLSNSLEGMTRSTTEACTSIRDFFEKK